MPAATHILALEPLRRGTKLAVAVAVALAAAVLYGVLRQGVAWVVPAGWAQDLVRAGVLGAGAGILAWLGLSLQRERRRLQFTQFALDQVGDPVFWIRPDGRVFYVNDAACEYLGYPREELLRLKVPDFDPKFPPEVWRRHWEELTRKRMIKLETLHRAKNGEVFPVEITARHMSFGGLSFNGAVVRDISARKRAEESLREARSKSACCCSRPARGSSGWTWRGAAPSSTRRRSSSSGRARRRSSDTSSTPSSTTPTRTAAPTRRASAGTTPRSTAGSAPSSTTRCSGARTTPPSRWSTASTRSSATGSCWGR